MNQSSGERHIQNQTFLRGHQSEEVPLLHAQPSRPLLLAASESLSGQSPYFTESGPRPTQGSDEEGVTLRCTADGKGDGVLTTRSFAAGETVMVGFLVGALKENDSHATQVGPGRWARHGGLGPKVNHSCDPNCGVRLNDEQAFDVVARQQIDAGQEVTFDYAMRNFTIDHFPPVCLCACVPVWCTTVPWLRYWLEGPDRSSKSRLRRLRRTLSAHDGTRYVWLIPAMPQWADSIWMHCPCDVADAARFASTATRYRPLRHTDRSPEAK